MKKKYKFITQIILIIVFSIVPVFSENISLNDTIKIEVLGEVQIVPYEVNIYYSGEILTDTELTISNKYDLTIPNKTDVFSIFVSGNQPAGLSLTVTVAGQQFRRIPTSRDSKEIVTDFYVNAVEVVEGIDFNNIGVSAGAQNFSSTFEVEGSLSKEMQNNPKVINFVLAWVGNDKLPAGDYSSDINIVYSVDS